MEREIKAAIKEIAGTNKDLSGIYVCSVSSVDIDNRTCDCVIISGDADNEIPNVRLSAEPNDGFIIEPEVGSTVIVNASSRNDPFIVMFSEVKNVYLTASDKITFNDGSYGGLVKVDDLVQRMNNIENKVNDVILFVNTHMHYGVTPGGGSSGTPTDFVPGSLTLTNSSQLQNPKIVHG